MYLKHLRRHTTLLERKKGRDRKEKKKYAFGDKCLVSKDQFEWYWQRETRQKIFSTSFCNKQK